MLKQLNAGIKRLSLGFPWDTLIYVDVNFEIESPQEDELQGTALKVSNVGFLSLVIFFRYTDDTITVDLGRITDHL